MFGRGVSEEEDHGQRSDGKSDGPGRKDTKYPAEADAGSPASSVDGRDKQSESEPVLSIPEKLDLLEKRFLTGDISLDEYKGMKARYEKEIARTGIHPEALRALPLEDSSTTKKDEG